MARVKIKYKNSLNKCAKMEMLQILCSNQIQVTKIIPVTDGFVILTMNDETAEHIFEDTIKTELKN